MEYITFNNEIAKKTKFDGYYATKTGFIISVKIKGAHGKIDYNKPRLHSIKADKDGYFEVCISLVVENKQKRIYYRVHRLIWETFKGEIPNGLTVDHIDKNVQNNDLSNLRLLTREKNTSIARKGIKSPKRKLYKLYKDDKLCGIYDRAYLQSMFNFSYHCWYKDNYIAKKIFKYGYKIKLIESVEDIEKVV